jgi:hypothetical protein
MYRQLNQLNHTFKINTRQAYMQELRDYFDGNYALHKLSTGQIREKTSKMKGFLYVFYN